MLKRYSVCLMSLVVVSTLAGVTRPAAAAKNDLLIVPDRQRMVALAFDVQALRQVVLISYRGNAASREPLLHIWNPRDNAWHRLSQEHFVFVRFMSAQPNNVYLVGSDRDLPPSAFEVASQARNLIRINSLNTAEAANILNETMKFSEREWKALAGRHGLQTRDLNVEKRKWGRFGPPGERTVPPPVASGKPLSADTLVSEGLSLAVEPEDTIGEIPVAAPAFVPDAAASQPLEPDSLPAELPTMQQAEELPAQSRPSEAPVPATTRPEDK